MPLTFRYRKPEKQLQHSRTESSRKHGEKTGRQHPGERKRRRREVTGASAPVTSGPQGRRGFMRCRQRGHADQDESRFRQARACLCLITYGRKLSSLAISPLGASGPAGVKSGAASTRARIAS